MSFEVWLTVAGMYLVITCTLSVFVSYLERRVGAQGVTVTPLGPKRRFKPLDAVILATVAAIVVFVVYKVDSVLAYRWDWSVIPRFLLRRDQDTGALAPNLFVLGLLTTIRLAFWSLIFSAIIGGIMGVMRTSRRLFPRMLSRAYVELIRNTPPLVFIFVFYFFISSQIMPLLGLDALAGSVSPATATLLEWLAAPPKLFSNFLAGVICLSMFSGAYVTEIVRAGIESVSRAQYEAGGSIGLSRLQIMRYVVAARRRCSGSSRRWPDSSSFSSRIRRWSR